jgi:hypothetical protein
MSRQAILACLDILGGCPRQRAANACNRFVNLGIALSSGGLA